MMNPSVKIERCIALLNKDGCNTKKLVKEELSRLVEDIEQLQYKAKKWDAVFNLVYDNELTEEYKAEEIVEKIYEVMMSNE